MFFLVRILFIIHGSHLLSYHLVCGLYIEKNISILLIKILTCQQNDCQYTAQKYFINLTIEYLSFIKIYIVTQNKKPNKTIL